MRFCPRRSTDTSKAHLLIFQLPFKGNTRRFHQRIFSSNNFSSTSFVFNETRIVLINRYGATIIKFDTTYTIYISVCVYIGRGNCPSSGLLLSGVVVVRGGSCPGGGVVRGGDVRSPPNFLVKHAIADRVYNNINNKTSFTYTEKEHFSYTSEKK